MSKWNRARQLFTDRRGNAMVLCATCMPLLIGASALGVDTLNETLARRQLQRMADSGALAGAYALLATNDTVSGAVTADLARNNLVTTTGTPTVQNAPTTGPYAGDNRAVRVALQAQVTTPFISFFRSGTSTVKAEATAAAIYTGKFCMKALENGNATGITFSGSSIVNLGCGVATNATSTVAIFAGGSSTVTASPIAAVGNVPSSSNYIQPTKLLPYSPPQSDPFESLPVPSVSGCAAKVNVQPTENVTISPGCYKGMDIKGTLTLQPGTYYIDGNSFDLGSQANVTGSGVTIVLTSNTAATNPSSIATMSIHGNAVYNLTAPKTGAFGGVLFYQDPRSTLGNTVLVNGNTGSKLEGAFYFPKAYLSYNGTSDVNTVCLQMVARRLTFSGNANIQNTCPTDSDSKAFDAKFVRLVA